MMNNLWLFITTGARYLGFLAVQVFLYWLSLKVGHQFLQKNGHRWKIYQRYARWQQKYPYLAVFSALRLMEVIWFVNLGLFALCGYLDLPLFLVSGACLVAVQCWFWQQRWLANHKIPLRALYKWTLVAFGLLGIAGAQVVLYQPILKNLSYLFLLLTSIDFLLIQNYGYLTSFKKIHFFK